MSHASDAFSMLILTRGTTRKIIDLSIFLENDVIFVRAASAGWTRAVAMLEE